MRLRTKLFLTSTSAMLLLWCGAFWSIQRAVKLRIAQMAQESFEGAKQGLAGMDRERIAQMGQAGRLVMNIPELRALIAEHNYEVSQENLTSLKERLDHLEGVVGASFVSVLDANQKVIAQSAGAPWKTPAELDAYCGKPEAAALIRKIFAPAELVRAEGFGEAEYGLWAQAGAIYRVVAIPLVFQQPSGGAGDADGALILGQQLDDQAARELGGSHNCQVTFFSGARAGDIVASSLPTPIRASLSREYLAGNWPLTRAFVFPLDGVTVHGSLVPLRDVASNSVVGHMLIQRDERDTSIERKMQQSLALIMAIGVLGAAIGSFVISAAITRPVARLATGVQKVAHGELDLMLPVARLARDELGELSASFNDMVSQLRSQRDLMKQVEQAKTANRAKSQFLANMSHEIRTPLNGVIGMIELLLGTGLSEQQRRYATLVKTSGDLLSSLLNDILDFSKIEAGRLEIDCIDFNLHESVEEVIALLNEKATKKHLELASQFEGDVPTLVRGDPDRLRQILVNLINNAIKFTASGSVVVRVSAVKNAQSLFEDSFTVRFAVTDTGIGVPQDRLDRLFKPFSQVDASTTRKFGGTGLGLAITKQLAELMGGAVGVESAPLRGSTFWFTIKLQRRTVAGAPASAVASDSMRVLVVDDSQTTRDVLHAQLKSWGVSAQVASNSNEAIAVLQHAAATGAPFTVAVVDADLPGDDGYLLARLIKSNPQLSGTALMALLPMESSFDDARLAASGFDAHMAKPVRQSQLYDALVRTVSGDKSNAPGHAKPHIAAGSIAESGVAAAANLAAQCRRILVAEDNEINQVVITEILRKAGYACEVVDNGRKAVDAVCRGGAGAGFDLIVMDCQMPEMDGFNATRVIRQKEAGAARGAEHDRRRVPIVALTANAMKGDREECLAAGMDGYCSKPVDANQLLTTIASLLANAPANPAAPMIEAPPAKWAPSTPTELPAIRVDLLLERCLQSPATVNIVIDKFEKQATRDVEQLQANLASADAPGVTRVAHALKGAASIVAADKLAELAARLESLGREQQLADMERVLGELKEEAERCVRYLPQVRSLAAEQLSASASTRGGSGSSQGENRL